MTRFVNHALFGLLVLLVVLAPIPLGSNRDWSWSLTAFLTGVISLAWLLHAVISGQKIRLRISVAIPLLFLFAVFWAWLQAQSWVPASWNHPVWELVAAQLPSQVTGTISLAPQDNLTAIMRLLSYGMVFFLAFQLARDRVLARRALWWIFAAGVIYAVYGLLSYWGVLREFLWYQDDAYGRDVRATFVNRNHFANWVGLVVLASLSIFVDYMLRAPRYPMMAMQSMQKRFDRFMARSWAPLAGIIILVSALVSSHSRGGFFATFCGGAILLFLIDRKQRKVSGQARAVAVAALLVSAVAFFITSEVLMDRYDRSEIEAEGRKNIYLHTAEAIGDNPILGYGYGAYEDGFRLYRGKDILKLVDFAHNTFLENVFELGLPAAFALFLSILGLVIVCLRGLINRHRDWVFPALGVSASVLVVVHANIDFGIQIPATAMLYMLIMGVSVAQSFSSNES